MTQDQDIELRNFEARVRQLMLAYQEERQRNAELQKSWIRVSKNLLMRSLVSRNGRRIMKCLKPQE